PLRLPPPQAARLPKRRHRLPLRPRRRPENHAEGEISMTSHTRCFALVACVVFGALGADWPQFLGPQRNGVSTETGLLQTWDTKGPPVLWQKDVGEGFSAPVIAGDRLILFHRVGDEEVVECLDAATGERKWKHTDPTEYRDPLGKGDGPRSTPLIADERVYT